MKRNSKHRRNRAAAISFSLLVIFLVGAGIFLDEYYYSMKIGPEQPIPFSHRVHVEKKNISCVFCHEGAISRARAGIPPLETCMLCHRQIIVHHPEIEKLREYYFNNEPVEWVKVEDVPDHAFFNHSVHVFRKVDCGECHGNVKEMDRIKTVNEFEMGFCIDCHRDEGATNDCFTCHR